jgi:hypothetical protein
MDYFGPATESGSTGLKVSVAMELGRNRRKQRESRRTATLSLKNYILFIVTLETEIVSPFKSPVMVTLWPA